MQSNRTYARLLVTLLVAGVLVVGADPLRAGGRWNENWTALGVGPGGAWGTATVGSRSAAIAAAIAGCENRTSLAAGRCGADYVTARAAWSLAYACGQSTILATGADLADARMAAINREIELKEFERVELEPCRPLVAIDPMGRVADPAMSSEILPLIASPSAPR